MESRQKESVTTTQLLLWGDENRALLTTYRFRMFSSRFDFIINFFTNISIKRCEGRNIIIEACFCLLCPAGEAEDDRQAGGHQSETEGRDGSLQEDNGQALAQSPCISEGKGIHAGGEVGQIDRHVRLELFGWFPSSPPCCVADWWSSPGAGVSAVFQAGDGASRTG